MDSVLEVVNFQRSIGAVPVGGNFSVRTNWGPRIDAVGGSLQRYIASYKGVTTYLTFSGFGGATGLFSGVLPGLLYSGPVTPGPSQSEFWNAIISAIEAAIQFAQNNRDITLALDWFSLVSPSGDISTKDGAIDVTITLLNDLYTTNSVTAVGQFELDVQNAVSNPFGWLDPKPVFNWRITVSLESSTNSIVLTITVDYDHLNNSNLAEIIAAIVAGVITAGILGPSVIAVAGGVASGIAVGASLTRAYDASVNNQLMDFLAKDVSKQPWALSAGPVTFTASHPSTREYILAMAVQLDPTTFNEIKKLLHETLPVIIELAEAIQVI